MGLIPVIKEFLIAHRIELIEGNYQKLFDDFSSYCKEHGAEDWVTEHDCDLLVILNGIGVTTKEILSKMTEIPTYMLYFCDDEKVIFPENITKIHHQAMNGNEVITSVVIPKSVTYIGECNFPDRLENLTLPKAFEGKLEYISGYTKDMLDDGDIDIKFI